MKKRALLFALVAFCAGACKTDLGIPLFGARRAVAAPETRNHIVNLCPHDNSFAPYGYIRHTAPWLDAACLKLLPGDRVYQLPGVTPAWKVLAKNDLMIPTGKLVWVIGVGAVLPPPLKTEFKVTFRFSRVELTQDTNTLAIEIFAARQVLAHDKVIVAPKQNYVDYEYTFTRKELARGITATVDSDGAEWGWLFGEMEIAGVDPGLNGWATVRVNNGFQHQDYARHLIVSAP